MNIQLGNVRGENGGEGIHLWKQTYWEHNHLHLQYQPCRSAVSIWTTCFYMPTHSAFCLESVSCISYDYYNKHWTASPGWALAPPSQWRRKTLRWLSGFKRLNTVVTASTSGDNMVRVSTALTTLSLWKDKLTHNVSFIIITATTLHVHTQIKTTSTSKWLNHKICHSRRLLSLHYPEQPLHPQWMHSTMRPWKWYINFHSITVMESRDKKKTLFQNWKYPTFSHL